MDVKTFWDTKLSKQLHKAFHVHEKFTAYTGDPRVFTWEKTVADFPPSHAGAVKALPLANTGIAAAARSDGRVGDGALMIEEWQSRKPVILRNHEVYQLAAGTLDPVAGLGDLLIVSNYALMTRHSLVVAAFGDHLLARRYDDSDTHPDMVVLTGQALEPPELPLPVLAPREKLVRRKTSARFSQTMPCLCLQKLQAVSSRPSRSSGWCSHCSKMPGSSRSRVEALSLSRWRGSSHNASGPAGPPAIRQLDR
ncbi:hypothetical protein [Bradyrhizobium paxllaeri]|uniref:hypothetical protein n=1 Tax=Bradyrhizobium paxllaeri TaxID=190148 RepID=UPI000828F5C1|nr:hypothetical protein [Bradyrhizobium paxllaeri]